MQDNASLTDSGFVIGANRLPRGQLTRGGPELSVIVPTFNEHENVQRLIAALDTALAGIHWEVVFVDDNSPDGTADLVREIAQRDVRVRCVHRVGRRGLSTACVEGMLATSSPFVAVIDGDLQHDETLLPRMLDELRGENLDIVVGTRYAGTGGIGDWDKSRASISRFATRLSAAVLRAELSDPMSGFFMMRRGVLDLALPRLSGIGFKILLDLFASAERPLRFKELPYTFRTRQAGESKLDSQAAWSYIMLLVDKMIGHIVPVRFIAFSLVGGVGVVVHMLVLTVLFRQLETSFLVGQTAAALVAMTFNFALNNVLTYRDARLRGWGWLKGWLSFVTVCSIGALANVGIASYLFANDAAWVLAALAGIAVGAVWNFAVTNVYTWGKGKAKAGI